jgi:serine/threonine protein kinase
MPAGMLLSINTNGNNNATNENSISVPEGDRVLYNPNNIDGDMIFERKKGVIGQGAESTVYLSEYEGARYVVRMQESDYMGRQTFIKNTQKYISVLGFPFVIPLLYAKVFVPYKTKTKSKYASRGFNYQIMPYIEGMTLDKFKGNSLTYDAVLDIITQLKADLSMLADRGFVHRDIKPANIFLSAAGKVFLIDFDTLCSGDDCLNFSEQIVGTRRYSRPNAFIRQRPYKYTPKYDLWSLGQTIDDLARISKSNKPDLISMAVSMQNVNRNGGKTRKHRRRLK